MRNRQNKGIQKSGLISFCVFAVMMMMMMVGGDLTNYPGLNTFKDSM